MDKSISEADNLEKLEDEAVPVVRRSSRLQNRTGQTNTPKGKYKRTDSSLNSSRSHIGSTSQESGNTYQLNVALLIIVSLLKNDAVKDFSVYYNHKSIAIFDDVVITVEFKNNSDRHVYAIQIKSREKTGKLYLNDTPKQLVISKYIKAYKAVMTSSDLVFFQNISRRNIHVYIFCDMNLVSSVQVRQPSKYIKFHLKQHEVVDTIVPCKSGIYYKYSSKIDNERQNHQIDESINKTATEIFFDELVLFANQGTTSEIKREIKEIMAINEFTLKAITDCIQWCFTNRSEHGLTKREIEIEFLSIFLYNCRSIPASTAIDMNGKIAHESLEIVRNFDVVLVEDEPDIERRLHGGIAAEVFGSINEWNDCIVKHCGSLTEDMKERARRLVKLENFTYEVDTLAGLELCLWKYNRFPLILKTDSKIKDILECYKHLETKIMIIGSLLMLHDEYMYSELKVFRHAGNIDQTIRREFLKGISISLQGRMPCSLDLIFTDDVALMETLTYALILNLMTQRKMYIREDCIDELKLLYRIEHEKIVGPKRTVENIKVYYKRPKIENPEDKIEGNSEFVSPKYHFERVNGKLILINGDKAELTSYFVDQYNHDIRCIDEVVIVPVIGRRIENDLEANACTFRGLRKVILRKFYVKLQNRKVFLVSGDIQAFQKCIRRKIFGMCHSQRDTSRMEYKLLKGKNLYIDGTNASAEDVWTKFSSLNPKMFCIEMSNKEIQLIKYKNCTNLSSNISYSKDRFAQADLIYESTNRIIVISGGSEIERASLFTALTRVDRCSNYFLVIDLKKYRYYLKHEVEELFSDPVEFAFNTCETVTNSASSGTYGGFLYALYRSYRKEGKLILFMNHFDRVYSDYARQTLKLVKKIAESKLRIIIPCSTTVSNYLIDELEVQPFQIVGLKEENE